VAVKPPRPIAPTKAFEFDCVRQPLSLDVNVAPLHGSCTSQWTLNLLRGVA
jgi:hypothetical protein